MNTRLLWKWVAVGVVVCGGAIGEVEAANLLPGDGVISPAAGDQTAPSIARGGNLLLAAWADTRANVTGGYEGETSKDIYGMRLDGAGNLLDAVPIAITAARATQENPKVVWNGTNWLVVFESYDLGGTGYYYQKTLAAVRVSPSGQVLDAKPIPLYGLIPSGSVYWAAASDGVNWVVVNQGNSASGDMVAVRISPAGVVLDPPTRALVKATYYGRSNLNLAYAGGVFLLSFDDAYNNGVYDTKAVRFDSSLALLDAAPLALLDSPLSDLAGNGSAFYIVWNRQNVDYSLNVAGSRVSTAGLKLDGNGVNLSGTKTPYAYATTAVVWDGVNWRVTWGEYSTAYTARVNASGQVLDAGSVAVPGLQTGPSAGNGAGGAQLVWTVSTDSNYDVGSAHIGANNAAGPSRVISLGAPRQIATDIATSGSGYMVVYHSSISSERRVMAQPLDAAGNPLTAGPILLNAGSYSAGPGAPNVAWNGSVYLVAWGNSNGIVAQRLLPSGAKVDPAPFVVMTNAFGAADVAAIGDTFLVTGRRFGRTTQIITAFGARVRGSDGAVLDATALALGGGYVSRSPAVTALGSRFLVAFISNATHDNSSAATLGVLVSTTGTNVVNAGSYFGFSTAGGNGIFDLGLASSGSTALLVQPMEVTSGVENDLVARLIQADGTAGPVTNLTPWSGNQYRPRVAWDGVNFILAYQDQRNRLAEQSLEQLDARSDIFAMRVSPTGTILDAQGFLLSASAIGETDPTVVSQSGVSLFAWAQMLNDSTFANYRIVTARLDGSANRWPMAVANVSTNAGDVPLMVNFSSAGSTDSDGSVISYLWDFADGSSSTAASPAHTFTTAGNYVVKLTVTDNLGASATQALLVKAMLPNAIPVAVARAVPQSGPPPLNVTLYADGSYDPDGPIGNIEWISDEGGSYWGSTAYFTFTVNGTHSVTLRVYDSGGAIGTTNILINVGGPNMRPVAVASASPTNGPAPLWVNFSAAGSYDLDGNIAAHAWNFGDGGTANYASPTHYYASAGTYTATVTVTDNVGGTGSATVKVWVGASNRLPVAVVTANPTKGTAPLAVNFSSAGSSDPDGSIVSYAWNFGDGGSSTAANPAHTYAGRGTYVARLTVTDNLGATGSESVAVTVRRAPQLTSARVAIPGTFTFTLEGETNATYLIQAACDSRTWTNVLTLPNPDMPAEVTLPVSSGNPGLFWRAVMQ